MKSSFRMAAAMAALTALALAGCAAPTSPGTDSGSPDAGPVKDTLNISTQSPTADLSVGNFTGGDPLLVFAVYDTLVAQGVDGELVPSIAESYEYSEDRTELTFTIREGQTFSDGEVVDAAAVVESLEASRVGPGSAAQLASVASVEATDEATVVVTLSQPDGALIFQLAGTPGVIGSPAVLGEESAKLNPIGSGPYVLDTDASTVGSEYVLTKNPDHWNADAYGFPTVNLAIIEDPTAVQNAMNTGQLDFATLRSPDLAAQFSEADFTTGESNPSALGGLFITDRAGSVVPALADVRVRQAINLAIDRVAIAESLTPGVAGPTAQIINPISGAYDPALDDLYAVDVEAAKALMAEAGYADGFTVTMPSTVLSTTFDATIAQQLGDIGITVEYESVPFQDLYSRLYAGAYGMFWLYNGYSGSDAKEVSQVLAGAFNPQATMTPELEELLTAANIAPLEEQAAAYRAVNEYFVQEAWFAPVSASTGLWVASNSIQYTPPVVYGGTLQSWQPAE